MRHGGRRWQTLIDRRRRRGCVLRWRRRREGARPRVRRRRKRGQRRSGRRRRLLRGRSGRWRLAARRIAQQEVGGQDHRHGEPTEHDRARKRRRKRFRRRELFGIGHQARRARIVAVTTVRRAAPGLRCRVRPGARRRAACHLPRQLLLFPRWALAGKHRTHATATADDDLQPAIGRALFLVLRHRAIMLYAGSMRGLKRAPALRLTGVLSRDELACSVGRYGAWLRTRKNVCCFLVGVGEGNRPRTNQDACRRSYCAAVQRL